MGAKIPKRDKFGIHIKIESTCLDLLTMSVDAALKTKEEKKAVLIKLRTHIEIAKHLVRISRELNIIEEEIYISIQRSLQEISKMANGWLKYTATA